jgi:hypothetical protein
VLGVNERDHREAMIGTVFAVEDQVEQKVWLGIIFTNFVHND